MAGNENFAITDKKRMTLQILNVVGFIIAMVFNGFSAVISPNSLPDIVAEWNADIAPANYAFAIWGVIYTLLAIFTVYQALPTRCVPSRNDKLIFGDLNYLFAANMVANGIWLPLFQLDTKVGFVVGLIDIIFIISTAVYMMMKTTRAKLNAWEFVSLRLGISIYSGWLTAATILNVTYMLKCFGVKDPELGSFGEEGWTILILYVAFLIYNVVSYVEKNPVYGSVFIWVIFAIINNLKENRPELKS